ncbi:MAG: hypothetical protein IIC01_12665 [Planctomycetes bacterium]|nr:hypothetical protein [Planctomycetota bacterium]
MIDTLDAKAKWGRDDALKLAARASVIVVARGSKVVTFSMSRDRPDEETLLAHLLGPTGRLRAPTLRIGKTLLVGFNTDAYADNL